MPKAWPSRDEIDRLYVSEKEATWGTQHWRLHWYNSRNYGIHREKAKKNWIQQPVTAMSILG